MIKGYTVLSVLMTLLLYFGQPRATYFYHLINKKVTNCPDRDNDVKLICQTKGNVSEMIIKRAGDEIVLYTSRGVNESEYLIEQVECNDQGEYQCIIDNTHVERTALVISDCPPVPCNGNTNISVYADINTPLEISLCILVYEDVHHIAINNSIVRLNTEKNLSWTLDYFKNKETHSACFRNVTIVLKQRNFTLEYYGEMSIRVYRAFDKARYFDFRISLKSPDERPSSQPTTTASDHPKVEQELHLEDEEDNTSQEDIITFLPPFLVIVGAVVLTVVMIIRKEKRNKRRGAIIPTSKEQIIPVSTNL